MEVPDQTNINLFTLDCRVVFQVGNLLNKFYPFPFCYRLVPGCGGTLPNRFIPFPCQLHCCPYPSFPFNCKVVSGRGGTLPNKTCRLQVVPGCTSKQLEGESLGVEVPYQTTLSHSLSIAGWCLGVEVPYQSNFNPFRGSLGVEVTYRTTLSHSVNCRVVPGCGGYLLNQFYLSLLM